MLKEAFKFIISGGLAAFCKLTIFVVLFSFFNVWYMASSVIAFIISIAVGFYMQKYFTFQNTDRAATAKQASIFIFVSLLNLCINVGMLYGLVEFLKFEEITAQVLVIGIIACWNFFVYRQFVFKKTPIAESNKKLPI